MATIINNPPATAGSGGNGVGFLVGVVLLILFVGVLIVYGVPMMRRMTSGNTPQINVPDKVDVNINTPQQY